MSQNHSHRRLRSSLPVVVSTALVLIAVMTLATGCAWLGVAANALPPRQVAPSYKGLAGQTIAPMVWADRGIRIDFPSLQLDTASSIQQKLTLAVQEHIKNNRELKEVDGATFPLQPLSVARYQRDHPEIEFAPIIETAPKLGITRLIYVEVVDFSTRSDASLDLYRGVIKGNLRVVEIADGKAKVAYEENDIKAVYPKKAPREGVLNAGDYKIYVGTIDAFTSQIARRLLTHEEEE